MPCKELEVNQMLGSQRFCSLWTRQAAKLQETPLSSLLRAPSYLPLPSSGFPEHCREMRADTPSFHPPFSPTSFVLCPFLPTFEFQGNVTLSLENRIAGAAPWPTGVGPALGGGHSHTGCQTEPPSPGRGCDLQSWASQLVR